MSQDMSQPEATLPELRVQMDDLNHQMLDLFQRRMDVAGQIARYKAATGSAIYDPNRERQIIADVRESAQEGMESYATVLFSLMMEMSRLHQGRLMNPRSELEQKVNDALAGTDQLFPPTASVACQGVEGAYSQMATDKMFKHPTISYFKNWEGVFSAIEQGFCDFGVLPLENSSAGTVKRVYDLMTQHDFHIVRTCRLKVDHCLLAKAGVALDDVKEIFSHEQAINQCAGFLAGLKGVKVTAVSNTAEAARMVASSDRSDVACLSSRACAQLYGLTTLARDVNDSENNYTRFACITKGLKVYPGADRTSLMMVLPHEPGSLYKVLARFYALDINLTKLESRPIPDRDFEFMFYFDLETSVYSPEFATLLAELDEISDEFTYLGSYSEIA